MAFLYRKETGAQTMWDMDRASQALRSYKNPLGQVSHSPFCQWDATL